MIGKRFFLKQASAAQTSLLERGFHASFYRSRYGDIQQLGETQAFKHYLKHGAKEGRWPRGDFDPAYYQAKYQIKASGLELFEHWLRYGEKAGFRGHPWIGEADYNDHLAMRTLFNEKYYVESNPDVKRLDIDPFEHYATYGWKENRNPTPWFNQLDYRDANDSDPEPGNPFSKFIYFSRDYLATFLFNGETTPLSVQSHVVDVISPDFDSDYYAMQFPTTARLPTSLIEHYIFVGWREGRDPNASFSTRDYMMNNPDIISGLANPFYHYLTQGRTEGRLASASLRSSQFHVPSAISLYQEHEYFSKAGPHWEGAQITPPSTKPETKILAYYLPQFHAIEENDHWWGAGFTEWRNVARGLPRFEGHYQPRSPERLGYYNLDGCATIRAQVELAKNSGIFGFCFYYYYFNGKRVLEKPIETFLSEDDIEFPFCILWANENWTRTWDGLEKSVLLKQDYEIDDDEQLLDDLARHMVDARYIRVDGRPLFILYRPGLIPDATRRIEKWRTGLAERCGHAPLMFMVQGFGDNDPSAYGLDGAIEFPPHKVAQGLSPINTRLKLIDPEFSGHVISYNDVVESAINYQREAYPLIRAVTPSWDNEARRPGRGMVLQGSTPNTYENWLRWAIKDAQSHPIFGESFVAVNAWNEWAEGAYLEPDLHFGSAYLNATARAVWDLPQSIAHSSPGKIALVGHDAYRHGAQFVALNLARTLSQRFGYELNILICGDGPLLKDYAEIAATQQLRRRDLAAARIVAKKLFADGFRHAILNTTVCGWLVPIFRQEGLKVTVLVHEMPKLIRDYDLYEEVAMICESADRVVFPSEMVQQGFLEFGHPVQGTSVIRPQGLYNVDEREIEPLRTATRAALNIPVDAKVVINVAYGDRRKGIDRFFEVADIMCARDASCYFLWVGDCEDELRPAFLREQSGDSQIRITGFVEDLFSVYAAADVFLMTSREDPYPSVVLEAFNAGLSVVALPGDIGSRELIEKFGTFVDVDRPEVAANVLRQILDRPNNQRASEAQAEIRDKYSFSDYAYDISIAPNSAVPKLSAIVPNYNYESYIADRLGSIFDQTYPIYETIVLDDCSTDRSVDVIKSVQQREKRSSVLIVNQQNSGSVFRQWAAGLREARGDYVWIAEADDLAHRDLALRLIDGMVRTDSCLGFCDSWQINSDGTKLGDSYKWHMDHNGTGAFDQSFSMPARTFLAEHLSVKNTILNVSSVIFRRDELYQAIADVEEQLLDFRVAGDWFLYCELLSRCSSNVYFLSEAMNGHRRHDISATALLTAEKHLDEVSFVQKHCRELLELPPDIKVHQDFYLDEIRRELRDKD